MVYVYKVGEIIMHGNRNKTRLNRNVDSIKGITPVIIFII